MTLRLLSLKTVRTEYHRIGIFILIITISNGNKSNNNNNNSPRPGNIGLMSSGG